jgi:DNA invertase Pin-like site-specific DNA recombinase
VSTARQGRGGLGLEAQRKAVADYLNGGSWELAKEFVEIEGGKNSDRPVLADAIKACRLYGAKLVIAKIDRLSPTPNILRILPCLDNSGPSSNDDWIPPSKLSKSTS